MTRIGIITRETFHDNGGRITTKSLRGSESHWVRTTDDGQEQESVIFTDFFEGNSRDDWW